MGAEFTVQMFDVLVYLIPGGALLLSLYPWRPMTASTLDNFILYATLIGAAFILGVLTHVFTTGLFGAVDRLRKTRLFRSLLDETESIKAVDKMVKSKYGIQTDDYATTFRYAEAYVSEYSPNEAASYKRLMALSLLCRNSVLPTVLAALSTIAVLGWNWPQVLVGICVLVAVCFLQLRGFVRYWSAAVNKVLRAYEVAQVHGRPDPYNAL